MTDLKQIISDIQCLKSRQSLNHADANPWYEISKVAYERGELIKLLSADDEYIYDAQGNLWLAHAPQYGVGVDYSSEEPLDISALMNHGVYALCDELSSDEFKETFVTSVIQMLNGTPKQVYFGILIFYILSADIQDSISPFYSYVSDQQVDDEIRPFLCRIVKQRENELRNTFLFEWAKKTDGLWAMCYSYSQKLKKIGAESFVEE